MPGQAEEGWRRARVKERVEARIVMVGLERLRGGLVIANVINSPGKGDGRRSDRRR